MPTDTDDWATLPPEQQRIRDKCYHPTGTFIPFPKEAIEQSIPERFELTASIYADHIAVKSRSHVLTYGELEQAANRLAQAILDRRGERVEPVALLFEKGAPLIVSILGALKAGKIFMPLNPAFPPARLRYMLDDSQAGLLVTHNTHLSWVKTSPRTHVRSSTWIGYL